MVSFAGAVLMAATAVGIAAIEGADALSAIAPAKPTAIPVLRENIAFLLPRECETCNLNAIPFHHCQKNFGGTWLFLPRYISFCIHIAAMQSGGAYRYELLRGHASKLVLVRAAFNYPYFARDMN
jgi:hypothetical protein